MRRLRPKKVEVSRTRLPSKLVPKPSMEPRSLSSVPRHFLVTSLPPFLDHYRKLAWSTECIFHLAPLCTSQEDQPAIGDYIFPLILSNLSKLFFQTVVPTAAQNHLEPPPPHTPACGSQKSQLQKVAPSEPNPPLLTQALAPHCLRRSSLN